MCPTMPISATQSPEAPYEAYDWAPATEDSSFVRTANLSQQIFPVTGSKIGPVLPSFYPLARRPVPCAIPASAVASTKNM